MPDTRISVLQLGPIRKKVWWLKTGLPDCTVKASVKRIRRPLTWANLCYLVGWQGSPYMRGMEDA